MLFTPTASHENLFGFIAQRWNAWKSRRDSLAALEGCGRTELARMAHDLSLTTSELRSLAGKGADAANLLYRRLADMGLDRAALTRAEPTTMWDMQKSCSLCESKKQCRHDFARGAESSAWQAYCPNDDTLSALASQTIGTIRRRPVARAALIADSDQRGRYAAWLGLLFVGLAWLVLLAAPPAILRLDRTAVSAPDAATAVSAPAVTCLDASCLNAEELAAVEGMRTIQAQGWIATTPGQAASLTRTSFIAQQVHAGEALACTKQGGTTFYGLMFQRGCSQGGLAAAKLDGYSECRSMSGGGACLLQ